MSKYNNIKSIPISSIPKNEIKEAIKEWAEGSSSMEKWLWACFNNDIETSGCHAGKHPYLDIKVNDSHDKIKKILSIAQKIDGVSVLVCPDGGNPLSGPDWYKPTLSFGFSALDKKSADDIFDRMSESIIGKSTEDEDKAKVFEHILDFHDFFAGKESGCNFRIKNNSGQYTFSIETFRCKKNLNYFTGLFEKAGLTKEKKEPVDSPADNWIINSSTAEDFNEKMIKCKDVIMEEWSLELPSEITPNMGFNTRALIMRRKFKDTPEGRQKFEKWLVDEDNNFISSLKSQVNNDSNLTINKTSEDKPNIEGTVK